MQIIVYTGAIMILFLFVLMLVGRDSSDSVVETLRGQRVAATVLRHRLRRAGRRRHRPGACDDTPIAGLADANAGGGNVPAIAELLFTKYLLAFEVTSALLITAAVGAMVLAHIEREPGSGAPSGSCRRRASAPAGRRRCPARASSPRPTRSPPRRCCPTARVAEDSSRRWSTRGCRTSPACGRTRRRRRWQLPARGRRPR